MCTWVRLVHIVGAYPNFYNIETCGVVTPGEINVCPSQAACKESCA